jgi:signal transduction histidine kinase
LNRHRRLADERDQLHWVVEHAVHGYVRINAADEILFSNAQARLWLGLAPARANRPREKFLATARRTYLGQPGESWQDWPVVPGLAAVGSRLLVRPETARAAALFIDVTVHEDSGGQLLRLRDVTERLGLARDQRSFQTMVSHKLRTPLNSVLGPLELLAAGSGGLSPEEIAGLTAMAHQGAERLNTAVEGVLRFTELSQRLPGGGRFELVGFGDLVRSVAEALALTDVKVALTGEARAQGIPWSRDVLEWVLFELLENARKFHPRHTPRVSVEVRVEETKALLVTFTDNGVTLSSEQLAEIGRPFTQGEKYFSGEVPGMGLGLASVFTLVWQAGGSCRMGNRADGPGVWTEVRWPQAPDGQPATGRTMG